MSNERNACGLFLDVLPCRRICYQHCLTGYEPGVCNYHNHGDDGHADNSYYDDGPDVDSYDVGG
jgi:hypothetical protein